MVLENVFEPDGEPVIELLDRLSGPRFRACLDMGHAHLFSRDVPAWVERLGSRIAYVHLHDNDGVWDLHRPPGRGEANLAGAMKALASLSDRPRINIEVYSREGILEALEWLGAKGFLAGEAG
ncbi:MAG: sugar phosphate isomerase/epimerase family protein [Planctomycetota bacterium]|jgi:sugar phosphate isomerase/epimerase